MELKMVFSMGIFCILQNWTPFLLPFSMLLILKQTNFFLFHRTACTALKPAVLNILKQLKPSPPIVFQFILITANTLSLREANIKQTELKQTSERYLFKIFPFQNI